MSAAKSMAAKSGANKISAFTLSAAGAVASVFALNFLVLVRSLRLGALSIGRSIFGEQNGAKIFMIPGAALYLFGFCAFIFSPLKRKTKILCASFAAGVALFNLYIASEKAKHIAARTFNAVFIVIWVILAIIGVIFWVSAKSGVWKKPPLQTLCFLRFCVCAGAALLLELTVFNYPFYLRFFAGNTVTEKAAETGQTRFLFQNLNQPVTSIYIDSGFESARRLDINIIYIDEDATRTCKHEVYRDMPYTRYINLNPCGKVSLLAVDLASSGGSIVSVTLNKPIPLNILTLRLVMLSAAFFTAFLLLSGKTKTSMHAFLFETRFENTQRQRNAYAVMVICALFMCLLRNGYVGTKNGEESRFGQVTTALLKGESSLGIKPSDGLLAAERPYDFNDRLLQQYQFEWDLAWYNGKYYVYWGTVPVTMLLLPVKALTGQQLPERTANFLYSVFALFFLLCVWKAAARRYLKNVPAFFFMLGALTLAFCSLLPARYADGSYGIAINSALCYTLLGLLLLFSATETEKPALKPLFCASLSFALAVGCRPTALLSSIFVPVFVYRNLAGQVRTRDWAGLAKTLCAISLPYILVALPIMFYNHERFGSVLEFGASYQLTVSNIGAAGKANPVIQVMKIITGMLEYFTNSFDTLMSFPFILSKVNGPQTLRNNGSTLPSAQTLSTYIYDEGNVIGLLNLPVIWLLFGLRFAPKALKASKGTPGYSDAGGGRSFTLALLAVSLLLITAISVAAGFNGRYPVDFAWMMVMAALFCACFWFQKDADNPKKSELAMKIVYILCFASIVICFLRGWSGEHASILGKGSALFHYVERAFGIVRN